jgi:hypothetical protein
MTIQNKIEDLSNQAQTYAGQGGFKKGKKAATRILAMFDSK